MVGGRGLERVEDGRGEGGWRWPRGGRGKVVMGEGVVSGEGGGGGVEGEREEGGQRRKGDGKLLQCC